jgi:hypothetical protein
VVKLYRNFGEERDKPGELIHEKSYPLERGGQKDHIIQGEEETNQKTGLGWKIRGDETHKVWMNSNCASVTIGDDDRGHWGYVAAPASHVPSYCCCVLRGIDEAFEGNVRFYTAKGTDIENKEIYNAANKENVLPNDVRTDVRAIWVHAKVSCALMFYRSHLYDHINAQNRHGVRTAQSVTSAKVADIWLQPSRNGG